MADIFKMITQGPRRERDKKVNDARLGTIIKNTESYEYAKKEKQHQSEIIKELEKVPNSMLGEERDKNNYLVDIPKISLRELDKKPPKEQLKTLKLEYNRVYDRLELLNVQAINNEKMITDIRMRSRDTDEMNREMRTLVRKIIEAFPGYVDLKELVSTGDWKKDEVFPLVEQMIKNFILRIKQVDLVIKQESEKHINENIMLREKIEQYKISLEKISELESLMAKQKVVIDKYKENELTLIGKVKAAREQLKQVASEYELKLEKAKKAVAHPTLQDDTEKQKMLAAIEQMKQHIYTLNEKLKEKSKVEYVEKIVERVIEKPVEVIVYRDKPNSNPNPKSDNKKDNRKNHNNSNEGNKNSNKQNRNDKKGNSNKKEDDRSNADKGILKNEIKTKPLQDFTNLEVEDDLMPISLDEDDLVPLDEEDDLMPISLDEDDLAPLDVEDDLIPLSLDEDDLAPLDVGNDLSEAKVINDSPSPLTKKSFDSEKDALAPDVDKTVNSIEPKHEPHFKTYFEENAETIKIDKEKLAKASEDKNHPLSPDYIETEEEDVGVMFDQTIDVYIQNLSLQQETLLKLLGRTGISRTSDLKQRILEDAEAKEHYVVNGKVNNTAINKDIAEMKARAVLSVDSVNYGGRGGGSFNVFALSENGKLCYKKLTGQNPVIAEKQRIVQLHASLEHGYLIKDSAAIFREMGYKVYTDLEDVTFKIDSKNRKVFDFIAEDKEGKLMYIEVERGTHTQEGFSAAMDKIYEFTKDFYFICPNENIKNKNTRKKFFMWVTKSLGGVQNADVVLNMTTIETLRKKPIQIWETTDLRNVD